MTDQHTAIQPTSQDDVAGLPAPPVAPADPTSTKRKRRFVLPVVSGLLILGLAVFGVMQYQATVEVAQARDTAVGSLATAKADLKDSNFDLTLAQSDLSTAESNLSDAQATLGVCADAATSAKHLHNVASRMLDAVGEAGDQDFYASADSLDAATALLDKVNTLVADNGYETVDELAAACSGGEGATT